MSTAAKRTRRHPNPDVDFPQVDPAELINMGHLPNGGEILGAVKFSTPERGAQADIQPTYLVSTIVVQHLIDRNVYPVQPKNVNTRVEKIYQEFCLVSKLIKKGNPSEKLFRDMIILSPSEMRRPT